MMGIIRDATALMVALRHRHAPRPTHDVGEGTEIGVTLEGTPIIFPLPSTERAAHGLVFAASGAGKTIAIADALVREWLTLRDSDEPASLVLIDPKGDLGAAAIAELATTVPEQLPHVHFLDPFAGFPLNLRHVDRGSTPLEIAAAQVAEIVGTASTARGSQAHLGMGSRQLDVLQNLLLATLDCEADGASMIWAIDALAMPGGFVRLARATRSERARMFLANANLGDELRVSSLSRLRTAFAATPALERMIGAPSAIDFSELTAPGQITVLDLGRPPGGMVSLQTFFATLCLRLVLDHLLDRPSPWTGHHTRVVIDEAQIVVPVLHDVLERVLTTGRSRGISVVLVTQSLGPITRDAPELLSIAMTNAPFKLLGRLSAQDAERFAREIVAPPGVEVGLSELRSSLVASITNLPNRTFYALTPGGRSRFTTRALDMDARAQAVETSHDAIERMRSRYALPEDSPVPRLPEMTPRGRPPRASGRSSGFG